MKILFYSLPLLFFYPHQYKKNLSENIIVWIIILFSIVILPKAIALLRQRINYEPVIVFLAYLVVLLSSTLISTNYQTSLILLLLHISYFVIFLTSPFVLSSSKSKEIFLLIFLITTTILSIISFYNTAVRQFVSKSSEGLSYMWVYWGHNHLAALLLFAIPLCIFFTYRYYQNLGLRVLFLSLLIFLNYSMILTSARGAPIALFITTILVIYFSRSIIWHKITTKLKLLLLVLFIITFLLSSIVFIKKFPSGMESRIFHWQKGIEIALTNPILGTGPGTYKLIPKYTNEYKFATSAFALNLPIQLASDTGLLGLITGGLLFYGLILLKCIQTIRNATTPTKNHLLKIAISFGLIALLINDLVDFDLQLPSLGLFFWLLSGLITLKINKC